MLKLEAESEDVDNEELARVGGVLGGVITGDGVGDGIVTAGAIEGGAEAGVELDHGDNQGGDIDTKGVVVFVGKIAGIPCEAVIDGVDLESEGLMIVTGTGIGADSGFSAKMSTHTLLPKWIFSGVASLQ